MQNRPLTRKEFLKLAGAGLAGGALLGASGLATGCASRADGMNVVLVIMDSVRKDHVGAYGNDWIRTPNLDVVARDSLRFSRPYLVVHTDALCPQGHPYRAEELAVRELAARQG